MQNDTYRIITLPTALIAAILLFTDPRDGVSADPETPEIQVDIERFMGTWHEIARYPNLTQRPCSLTQVHYELQDDGMIEVENSCITTGGKRFSITGRAWSTDPPANTQLSVQMIWPFRGSYSIIQLDDKYRYAVISNQKQSHLWIISRQPQLGDDLLNTVVKRLKQQGFEPGHLIWSPLQQ